MIVYPHFYWILAEKMHEMEGFKGKWLQISAELYDEFLKVSKAVLKPPCPVQP